VYKKRERVGVSEGKEKEEEKGARERCPDSPDSADSEGPIVTRGRGLVGCMAAWPGRRWESPTADQRRPNVVCGAAIDAANAHPPTIRRPLDASTLDALTVTLRRLDASYPIDAPNPMNHGCLPAAATLALALTTTPPPPPRPRPLARLSRSLGLVTPWPHSSSDPPVSGPPHPLNCATPSWAASSTAGTALRACLALVCHLHPHWDSHWLRHSHLIISSALILNLLRPSALLDWIT
jgi:hypothetical protein